VDACMCLSTRRGLLQSGLQRLAGRTRNAPLAREHVEILQAGIQGCLCSSVNGTMLVCTDSGWLVCTDSGCFRSFLLFLGRQRNVRRCLSTLLVDEHSRPLLGSVLGQDPLMTDVMLSISRRMPCRSTAGDSVNNGTPRVRVRVYVPHTGSFRLLRLAFNTRRCTGNSRQL
jgi:hypothetical protein